MAVPLKLEQLGHIGAIGTGRIDEGRRGGEERVVAVVEVQAGGIQDCQRIGRAVDGHGARRALAGEHRRTAGASLEQGRNARLGRRRVAGGEGNIVFSQEQLRAAMFGLRNVGRTTDGCGG